MFKVGDKVVLAKTFHGFEVMSSFSTIGDVFEVVNISGEYVELNADYCDIILGIDVLYECFEKYEEPVEVNTVTEESVMSIIENSEIITYTVFDKCTVVCCKLPNGFVLVESSACVDPENYDEEMGVNICLDKITDRIWELEGYRLQHNMYRDFDECLDTDLDCDDCTNYDCPSNPRI